MGLNESYKAIYPKNVKWAHISYRKIGLMKLINCVFT